MSELKQTIRYTKTPDGRAIAWSTMGSGPPLVVFSSIGHLEADLRCQPSARLFRDLSSRCTLIRYDGRGCGLSDRAFQEISLDNQVADALAVVDAARLDRFSIFTIAGGPQQAIEFAARFPGRIDKLVSGGGFARGFLRRNPTPAQIAIREALYTAMEVAWEDPAFLSLNARQMFPVANFEEIEAMGTWHRAAFDGRQAVAILRWQSQTDVSAAAAKVACPALVVHTRHDPRIPFDEGRRLASLIPNAEFFPVDSRNNWVMPSEPVYPEVMERIIGFLTCGQADSQRPGLPHLTPREHQVLELIAQGKDNLQIAAHLNLSEKTVRNHITPIFDKLQVENRAQAIVRAREAGMGKR